ncbi:MAG TPA: glutathione S-transferase family protein [Hyphomicrobiales bacterium]|nr:glutathione S-transferase family protein [Hyphomicrobiales bacterium]
MIKIYGRPTAWNVRKVLFFLEDAGLPYERLDYGRGYKPTNTPEFLALNPNGLVPALVDDGFSIWESHTIMRYLAAKNGLENYYPTDLKQRAAVDQWLDWKIAHVSPAIRPLFFRHFLKMGEFTDREVAEGEAECAKLFTILDGQLGKTGAFVAGTNITIADCSLGMAVHRWLNLPVKRPELRNIARYYEALSARPSYEATVRIGMP